MGGRVRRGGLVKRNREQKGFIIIQRRHLIKDLQPRDLNKIETSAAVKTRLNYMGAAYNTEEKITVTQQAEKTETC